MPVQSPTDIVNVALGRLGHATIANFQEKSKAARLAKLTYETIRDAMMRDHPWNFAAGRVSLSATGTAPAHRYSRAYTIPADNLRILRVNFQDPAAGSWRLEGDEIVTDLGSPIEVEYVKLVTAVGLYDASFVNALTLQLASDWVEPLAKASTLKAELRTDLAIALQNARTSDGQESTTVLFAEGDWLTSRTGR